ncbi:Hat transposon superfamily, partial [Thalictrum thalictroides]
KLDCIERLLPDKNIQDKINKELIISCKKAVGDFGRKMATRAAHTLLPAEWWSTYRGGCPNFARITICILSQSP